MSHAIKLTERDHDVLAKLGSYRFMSSRQLAELAFPSEEAATRRLRELARAGLAIRIKVPVRTEEATPSTVWGLRRRGAVHVAEAQGGVRPPSLTPAEERTGHFLEHTLARNDFRVVLERLHELHPRFTLLSWRQQKNEVRRAAIIDRGSAAHRRTIIPDGVALVRVGAEFQALALEADRATVQPKSMQVRYQAYWRYWRDGGKVQDFGSAPYRVLTVTRDERHLERLLEAARKAPDGRIGTKLFWFALQRDVNIQQPEQLLAPIWSVASRNPMRGQRLFEPRLLQS